MNFILILFIKGVGIVNESQIMVLELGSKGYSCAQILFAGALALMGEENELLIRSMSALSQGGGNLGKTCGALSGGLCLLSLYAGKGNDFEQGLEKEAILWEELTTWFELEFCKDGDLSCDALLAVHTNVEKKKSKDRMRENAEKCGLIVAKTWDKCQEILLQHGFDPFNPIQENF